VSRASGPPLPKDWRLAAGGGGALLGLGAAAGALVWYRRRQQQSRPYARLRRSLESVADTLPDDDRFRLGGAGGGLLLALALATLLGRSRGMALPTPAADALPDMDGGPARIAALRQRQPTPVVGLAVAAVALGIVLAIIRRAGRGRMPPAENAV
jgi:hypothetical protein